MMFLTNPVAIIGGARIPQARQNGALLHCRPLELSALVARHAVERSGLAPGEFDAVDWGMMYQTEGSSVHLPKQTALAADLPATVTATLTNRLCCSGMDAIVHAARAIALGEIRAALAGSIDCISRVAAINLGFKQELPGIPSDADPLTASTLDEQAGKRMAELAEYFSQSSGIDRVAMDDFAFASRQRAAAAQSQGLFDDETVPVPPELLGTSGRAAQPFERDQIESRWPRRESLERLPSRYSAEGRITRGNTSSFADGAAAVALASAETSARSGRKVLALIRSWAMTAAGPCQPGAALVSAIQQALARARLTTSQIDSFELEEAFAANCVYAVRTLDLPPEKVNPHGGALALGHPPATSGLRHLLHAAGNLRTSRRQFALIGLAAGASQATAMVIEAPA